MAAPVLVERYPWWARALAPALVATAALLLAAALGLLLPALKLAAAHLVTPVAKEAWVALAHRAFGVPALLAAVVMLSLDAAVALACVLLVPVERAARHAPRLERLLARVRASRLARRSLAGALAGVIALPFHSGGAIVGSLAGRIMGLSRRATLAAVVGGIAVRYGVVLVAVHGFALAYG